MIEKSLKNFFKVAPSPCWSGKSRRLHLVLESLEIARFGRAGHAISWPGGSRHIRLGRESRALVFRSRKSGNGNSWSRESGHTKYESRCFGRATSASVAIVATDHHGRKSLEMPNFGLESLDMPKFVAKLWTWVWDLDSGRPLKNRLKTTQILLEKPFKNHRKKWAAFEQFLSKIWAVWAVFPRKPPKPLKPLKSCWKTAQTAHILLKNRSKTVSVIFERFFKQDLSGFKRFLSGLPGSRSQTHVHTFATKFWHVQIFQTKMPFWAGSRPGFKNIILNDKENVEKVPSSAELTKKHLLCLWLQTMHVDF